MYNDYFDCWNHEKGRFKMSRTDFTPFVVSITVYLHKVCAFDNGKKKVEFEHMLSFSEDGD